MGKDFLEIQTNERSPVGIYTFSVAHMSVGEEDLIVGEIIDHHLQVA